MYCGYVLEKGTAKMKKLYQRLPFIQFNKIRSCKVMKKRSKRKKSKLSSKSGFIKHCESINAPICFSLVNNTVETQIFFKTVLAGLNKKEIHINLKQVTQISIETVLYLVTIMAHSGSCKIYGNAPEKKDIKKIFLDSGFYKYVVSTYRHNETSEFISIKVGTFVQSEIAGEVIQFARDKLLLNNKKLTRDIYTTIMELMINVKEHASRNEKLQEWWLVAYHNDDKNCISFAILDCGRGIPTTIKRKFRDLFYLSDSLLLKSTLLGEKRSETNLPYRGKGLPKIYEYALENKVKNLYIMSNKGFFSSEDSGKCKDLDIPFKGTLVCWDFIPEVRYENY